MPYICMAQPNIPGGTVQVLDLSPNASQRNPSLQPYPQTLYVNPAQNDAVIPKSDGTLVQTVANGISAYIFDRVAPQAPTDWTAANLATISAALLARVQAGETVEVGDVNTILGAVNAGTTLTGGGSTGVLTDLLSILAGRGYQIPRFNTATPPVAIVYQTGGTVWVPRGASGSGSFTYTVYVHGDVMIDGVITSNLIGGDPKQYEFRPILTIAMTDSLAISLATGELAAFAITPGPPTPPPITLWPESSNIPHFPWTMQPGALFTPSHNAPATVTSARVLTVYNSDGSILS